MPRRFIPATCSSYPDAFDGVRASVRYVVDRGSLIQCVVLAQLNESCRRRMKGEVLKSGSVNC
ncbi:MAG: hypothetical protein L0Y58_05150 [Verrucomicrobia subdivision 3 bacterium]|nr:hypothetical protein [Limisphaerales bacterium]